MSSVVPAPDRLASVATRPSPKSGLTASLASAPPVSGRPPMPSASTAATASTSQKRAPLALAAMPTARNRAPLASTWCAAYWAAGMAPPASPAAQAMPSTAATTPIWLTLE